MQNRGTERIETPRLVLRRFTLDDAEAMFNNWAGDPEVTKFLTWPAHKSIDVSREVLESWVPLYENTDCYQWAVVLKENGEEPVGCISVVSLDENVQKAQIGYCIGKKWWHRGITSEALSAVIDFLFTKVQVRRIEARHDPRNPNSGKVMQKCGMKYEGTLRQSDINNQGFCDAAFYSVLLSERYPNI